jgi:hypothetical protein
MSFEQTYQVTFMEIIRHTGTIRARSEKAARTIVSKNWDEIGDEAFQQESLGMAEFISVEEVRS